MAGQRESILPQFRLQPLENEGNNTIESLDFNPLDRWLENADRVRQAVEEDATTVLLAFRTIWKEHGSVIEAHNALVDRVNELEASVQEKESGVLRTRESTPPTGNDPTTTAGTTALPPPPLPAGPPTGAAAAPPSPTPAPTVPTSASSTGENKSTKIPDPEVFTSGVKEPQFKHWLLQIEGKLVANADHFPTEAQRMTYVQSCVGGDAMGHLAQRLRRDAVIRFTTAQQMLDCLEAVYGDPSGPNFSVWPRT